ncbi:hypothetical protein ACVWZV_003624 [Bradyrhizobium sp. GM5.1]
MVGSSAISSPRLAGQRHRDHYALAHAAGEAMRMLVEARFRRRYPHAVEQAYGLDLRRRARQAAVLDQCFRNLEADGQHRIEARHWLLEDHGDFVATNILHARFGQRQQVATGKPDAAFDAAVLLRNEPHDRERSDALARTGLADDRHGFPRGNIERHVADDGNPSPLTQEGRRQAGKPTAPATARWQRFDQLRLRPCSCQCPNSRDYDRHAPAILHRGGGAQSHPARNRPPYPASSCWHCAA